ncbi:MAG: (2Fe-2S)-binding protein [Alphaproteobacteria bacterium]
MYVCLCNAIKDQHIEAAIRDGADSVSAVHHRLGSTPSCRSCDTHIERKLSDAMHRAAPRVA